MISSRRCPQYLIGDLKNVKQETLLILGGKNDWKRDEEANDQARKRVWV